MKKVKKKRVKKKPKKITENYGFAEPITDVLIGDSLDLLDQLFMNLDKRITRLERKLNERT